MFNSKYLEIFNKLDMIKDKNIEHLVYSQLRALTCNNSISDENTITSVSENKYQSSGGDLREILHPAEISNKRAQHVAQNYTSYVLH